MESSLGSTISVAKAPVGCLLSVDFAIDGNSGLYREEGWSGQEKSFVWAVGSLSTMRIPAPWDDEPYILDLDVNPHVFPPFIEAQLLAISVNGHALGVRRIMRRTIVRCLVPPEVGRGGVLNIAFAHPSYFRPSLVRSSGDDRPLAVSFFSLRLYPMRFVDPCAALFPITRGVAIETASHPELSPQVEAAGAQVEDSVRHRFAVHCSAVPFCKTGWAEPEERFRWSNDTHCQIDLPAPVDGRPRALHFHVVPFVESAIHPEQDVTVIVNGAVIAQYRLDRPVMMAAPVPVQLLAGGEVASIVFLLPRAISPRSLGLNRDSRDLGLCFHEISLAPLPAQLAQFSGVRIDEFDHSVISNTETYFNEIPDEEVSDSINSVFARAPDDILRDFESLGSNCEFGVFQRKMGVEILGLLRFGNSDTIALLQALRDDFKAVNEPGKITLSIAPNSSEFLLNLSDYGIRWHTFMHADQMDPAEVLSQQSTKLRYVRRKFMETLRASRKIFVIKRSPNVTPSEALEVLIELNRYGINRLLVVVDRGKNIRFGSVERLGPLLMRGNVAEFAPQDAVEVVAPEAWIKVCANALRLSRSEEPVVVPKSK